MKKIYFLVVSLLAFSVAFSQTLTFEGFDGATFPPAGWVIVDGDGDTFEWIQSTVWVGIGDTGFCATSSSWDPATQAPLTPDNWLISPMASIVEGDSLVFWIQPQDPSYEYEKYAVMVSTVGQDIADFTTTLFEEVIPTTATDWTEHKVDISAYVGQDVYFAFRHYDCTDAFFLNLDNVEIRAGIVVPTTVNVTFTVDCNSLTDIDTTDVFYIAGDFAGWTTPGDSLELALEDGDGDGVYSVTCAIEPGDSIFYKYFRGAGWDGGEWAGDPDRSVFVNADTTVTDWWGALAIETIVDNDINIYPNPTNNILNITNIANAKVRIFNIIGKEVVSLDQTSDFTTIDMSNFAEGTYIVKIFTNSNIITRKISLIK